MDRTGRSIGRSTDPNRAGRLRSNHREELHPHQGHRGPGKAQRVGLQGPEGHVHLRPRRQGQGAQGSDRHTNRKGVVTKRLRFTKSGVLKVTYKGTSKYQGGTQTIRVTVRGR